MDAIVFGVIVKSFPTSFTAQSGVAAEAAMSRDTVWVPASPPYAPFEVATRPIAGLGSLSRQERETLRVPAT